MPHTTLPSQIQWLLLLRAERLALKFVIALDKSRPNACDEHPAYRIDLAQSRGSLVRSFGRAHEVGLIQP